MFSQNFAMQLQHEITEPINGFELSLPILDTQKSFAVDTEFARKSRVNFPA